jgi:hypothetical protein
MARAILLVVAALLLVPPAAEAVTPRYAGPNGSMTIGCTDHDNPCDIASAFSQAQMGDEVIIETGDYGSPGAPLSTGIASTTAALDVHGEAGKPIPRIYTNATVGLSVTGASTHIEDLEVDQVAPASNQVAFNFDGAEATRVIARDSASGGVACVILGNSVLSDSVCAATGSNGWGVRGYKDTPATNHSTLRNVTALASISNSGTGIAVVSATGVDEDITVTNSIADASVDLYAFKQSGGGIARITLDHSNWTNEATDIASQPGGIVKDNGGNVRFVAAKYVAPGDYHQAAGSPTIDKGADDPANGPSDPDGDARTLGPATDIGADEFRSPPVVTTGAATGVTKLSATLNGTVNPDRLATTYHFEYGTTNAYGASTPSTDAGAGAADVPASAALSGLTPGTTYHYRLVATNAGGTIPGADMTLTTLPAAGGGGTGGKGPHFVGGLKLAHASFAAAKRKPPLGTKVTYTLTTAATVRFTVERAASGRRSGKRCVKPTKKNRTAKKCTRYIKLKGAFSRASTAGPNGFKFNGRLNGKKLPVGRYRLVASIAQTKDVRRASFKIVRR